MSSKEESKVNISTAPDYNALAKAGSNTAILEYCLKFFQKNRLNPRNFASLITAISFTLVLKSIMENSTIDKMKLTDINIMKYMAQKFMNGEKTIEVYRLVKEVKNDKKGEAAKTVDRFVYNGIDLFVTTFNNYFEKYGIQMNRPGTYYFNSNGFLIAFVVQETKYTLYLPNVRRVESFFIETLKNMKEVILGNNTVMCRLGCTPNSTPTEETIVASYAYETENYKELRKMVKSIFGISALLEQPRKPMSVIFNGEPGMGKTTFGNYMAGKGDADVIITVNLVQFSKTDNFAGIINRVSKKIDNLLTSSVKEKRDQTVIIILDELDKYYVSFSEKEIQKLQDKAREGQTISKKKDKDDSDKSDEKVFPPSLTEEEIKQKKSDIRNDIFDCMYQIAEGISVLKNERKIVVVYCTNHFEEFFAGADKRYNALTQRLCKFYFKKIGKSKVVDFLKDIAKRLKTAEEKIRKQKELNCEVDTEDAIEIDNSFYNVSEEDYQNLIPDTISISFRVLDKIITLHNYNLKEVLKNLSDPRSWADDNSIALNGDESI